MAFRFLSIISFLIFSSFSMAETNLSDAIDSNEIEAQQETRENETINLPDSLDENKTPSGLEDREREEEWREEYDKNQADQKDASDLTQ